MVGFDFRQAQVDREGQQHADGGANEAIAETEHHRAQRACTRLDAIKGTDRAQRSHDDNQTSVVPFFQSEPASFFSVVPVRSSRLP